MVAAAASVAALALSRDRRSGVNSVISVSSLMYWPLIGQCFQINVCACEILPEWARQAGLGGADVIICAARDQCAVQGSLTQNAMKILCGCCQPGEGSRERNAGAPGKHLKGSQGIEKA
jgi:hypothetical protein